METRLLMIVLVALALPAAALVGRVALHTARPYDAVASTQLFDFEFLKGGSLQISAQLKSISTSLDGMRILGCSEGQMWRIESGSIALREECATGAGVNHTVCEKTFFLGTQFLNGSCILPGPSPSPSPSSEPSSTDSPSLMFSPSSPTPIPIPGSSAPSSSNYSPSSGSSGAAEFHISFDCPTAEGNTSFFYVFEEGTLPLTFSFSTCGDVTRHAGMVEFVAMNPNGEHLSAELIPLPTTYLYVSISWGVICLGWFGNWLWFRSLYNINLHRYLTAFPVAKVVSCAFAVYYWKDLSVRGVNSLELLITDLLLFGFAKAALFTALLLIALGWGIMLQHLGYRKYVIAAESRLGLVIIVSVSMMLGEALHGYFTFISFVVYLFVLVMIIRFVNVNLLTIEVAMRSDQDPMLAPKRRMFLVFKYTMMFFIFATLMILLMNTLLLRAAYWLSVLFHELFEMIVCVGILFTFRLRTENIYYTTKPAAPTDLELSAAATATARREPNAPPVSAIEVAETSSFDVDEVVTFSAPQALPGENEEDS